MWGEKQAVNIFFLTQTEQKQCGLEQLALMEESRFCSFLTEAKISAFLVVCFCDEVWGVVSGSSA